ncbi:MAG: type II CRISPR-associated endonuclease Cas1 [Alphaproteobacteria bacterium]
MKLRNDDGEFTLPIEDITTLILESPQITLSSTLLSACQEQGVAILTCDLTHMPNGVLLPFQPHSRQSRVAHIQSTWTDSLKNRLWQRVIQSKIRNQATCLDILIDEKPAKPLYAMAERVKSGDPNNIEAQAARDYWPKLMGKDFRRGSGCIINAALNYSYAVLRAYVARSQVAYGLLPTFGIHHNNQLNAFNLTDDFMEVFRPFADKLVWEMKERGAFENDTAKLSVQNRQTLANIGNVQCKIDGQNHTIGNACDKIASSLVNAIEGKSPVLMILPEFNPENNSE